ncbi:MAG TPA: 7TM diverse intracellular signaling domain-containing protein [Oligoflexus sp.]|uniref:7TM diverse intracellular signaling domain-containing protein n=1 Tax=Oligoflexus sp. TaxID=1971216 RepID=UPI002D800E6D|nr:7TM diverse intracellular signaling domain-containing protein [Oligoflexus sp.]HET9241110.1 7TM diverse intracellular signaling domain-containing protein [Oligoflexus sp.]
MLRITLLVLLSLWSSLSVAEARQMPVKVSADLRTVELDRSLWFLEDKENRYSADHIQDTDFLKQFAPTSRRSANFGFTTAAVWARVPLLNTSNQTLDVILTEAYAITDAIDFWLIHPATGTIEHARMGDQIPFDKKRQFNRIPSFQAQLLPGESWLLMRIQTQGSAIYNVTLFNEQTFYETRTKEYVFLFSCLCILTVMAFYNFFIWLQLRKLPYLVYFAFILAMVIQSIAYSGLIVHGLDDYTGAMNRGYIFTANLSAILACLFPLVFLSLRGRHPWLERLCYLGIVLCLVSDACLLHSYNLGAKTSVLGATMASVITLTCGIVCSLKRYRPAYFFTLAWLALIIGNVIRMAMASGIIPASFWSEWSVLIGSVIEVVLLSLALADKVRLTEKSAFARIEKLNVDLHKEHEAVVHLNNNLERMVEEQTREIKSILKHIQIGIMIVGRHGLTITETHSESVKTLFHTDKVASSSVLDLLFKHAQATEETRSVVQTVLENSLDESDLNFHSNSHLLPTEMNFRFGEEVRVLQLDWNPVIDRNARVEKMLISVKDVTALKKLEAEAAEKSKELEYIGEILDVTPKQFGIFVNSAQRFLSDNKRLLRTNHRYDKEILKILFINMHTIKGSARALGLSHLTPLMHDAEQRLAASLSNIANWNRDALLDDCQKIQDLMDTYQDLNQVKLGRNVGDSLALSHDLVERIRNFLRVTEEEGVPMLKQKARSLKESIEELTFVRAETVFREVLSNAEMLARDLQKESPLITIEDRGICLSSEAQELIRNTFIHIIRNSMDHGIESAAERLAAGKSKEGHIFVQLDLKDDGLYITYRDDGRGLNLRAIHQIALDKGLIKAQQKNSLEEIAYLIFEPGFSTAQSVTDISGRGVGMNAVKDYIEAKQGSTSIRLHTSDKVLHPEFVPFEFVIRLYHTMSIQKSA